MKHILLSLLLEMKVKKRRSKEGYYGEDLFEFTVTGLAIVALRLKSKENA